MTTAPRLAAAALCLASAAAAQEQSITTGLDVSDATGTSADLFVNDATSLSGFACVGFECTDEYVFGGATAPPLVIQDFAPGLEIRPTGLADEIWSIETDTVERFVILVAQQCAEQLTDVHGLVRGHRDLDQHATRAREDRARGDLVDGDGGQTDGRPHRLPHGDKASVIEAKQPILGAANIDRAIRQPLDVCRIDREC